MSTTTYNAEISRPNAISKTDAISKGRLWSARSIIGLVVLFMLFDGFIHLINIAPVKEGFADLGYPANISVTLGIIELIAAALVLIPRTSIIGAILLTGYFGGAIATHVRVENPLFSHILFPVYLGVLLWGGLALRDSRLRGLLPLPR